MLEVVGLARTGAAVVGLALRTAVEVVVMGAVAVPMAVEAAGLASRLTSVRATNKDAAMRRFSSAAALFLVWSIAVLQAQKASPEEEIEQMESRRVRAMIAADVASLETILASDVTYVHSNAQADDKDKYIADLKSGLVRYTSIEREDVKVRAYGGTAVVTGRSRQKSVVKGRPPNLNGIVTLFTGVYVKTDGRWQLVALQSTRLPD